MIKRVNAYERALLQIEEELLLMSKKVSRYFVAAIDAFNRQDVEMASKLMASDDEIDNLDEDLERQSLKLLSLQQPADLDLRILASIMRISRDLERIGDYACDIAETTLKMKQSAIDFQSLTKLQRLADLDQKMLEKCFASYNEKDLIAARQMDNDDMAVDELYESIVTELIGRMKQDSEWVELGSVILLIARYLERIGDHVVNIAEMVIFVGTGERHPFKIKAKGGE